MAGRYSDDNNRDRWHGEDRGRSDWRTRDRDDERGFFERAGQEVRSWFSDDDDRGGDRSSSSWDRDRNGSYGSGYPDRDRQRGYGSSSENRSSFGGMAQGGLGGGQSGYDRSTFQGSQRQRGDRDHAQSWGEANRGQGSQRNWNRDKDDGTYGYGSGIGGTLGGFGNQTFGSSQDDHYRSWRDRQLSELDRDYDDYCREREQKFHSDFDSWRSSRSSQSPSVTTNASSADLGAASNAGVGTTTASMTGSAGAGSAIGSATGTGGSIQADTTGSTETAGAGTGASRSGSRSRS